MIEVVSGVIIQNGRILLTQRRADKDFPFCWESPGGKVEAGESHHDALRREIGEELGVDIRAIANSAIWCREFHNEVSRSDRRHIFLLMYRIEIAGTPTPREGQGIGWFTAPEVHRLILAPGNQAAVDVITSVILGNIATGRTT